MIDAYRGKLMEVSPAACNEVDDRMWADKKTRWVCDAREIDLDRLMSAQEIADRFGFSVQNVRDWARRHPDKIKTHKQGRRALYLLREVLKYQSGT